MNTFSFVAAAIIVSTTLHSFAKVPDCKISNSSSQILIETQKKITSKFGFVNSFTEYEFLLLFQVSSSALSNESLRPLPGEDQITFRKRLIGNQQMKVAEGNEMFLSFLDKKKLSHVYIPGPKTLKVWTIKAKIHELEYILKASDICEIHKISNLELN